MRDTVNILGIPIDNVNMDKAVDIVKGFLAEDRVHAIYTPNSEIMMEAQRDQNLKEILCEGDLLIPDGAGVVLASKILGHKLPERVAGFDLVCRIFELPSELKEDISLFLLGAKPGVAEEAAANIINKYKGVNIVGCHHGYFQEDEESKIIDQINASGAQILLVALGAPKQEKWIHKNKDKIKARICMGVGGSLDILAGRSTRAPEFYQKHGLEWLYRLYKEPWRYKRMLDLPRFMLTVLKKRVLS